MILQKSAFNNINLRTLSCDCQSGNNVDVADRNLLDELSILGEDLHTRALAATVTDHILARCADYSDLAWVPQLTFFTTYDGMYVFKKCVSSKNFGLENFRKFIVNFQEISNHYKPFN